MSNQLTTNFDWSKIFVGHNRYKEGVYTNSTYAEKTLKAGTVMARDFTSGELVPFDSAGSNGANIPVGILLSSETVAAGDSVNVSYCIAGDVVQEKVVFDNGTDTLDTPVAGVFGGRPVKDCIEGMTSGVILVASEELTKQDNQ